MASGCRCRGLASSSLTMRGRQVDDRLLFAFAKPLHRRDQPLEILLRFEGSLAQTCNDGRLVCHGLLDRRDAQRNFVVERPLEGCQTGFHRFPHLGMETSAEILDVRNEQGFEEGLKIRQRARFHRAHAGLDLLQAIEQRFRRRSDVRSRADRRRLRPSLAAEPDCQAGTRGNGEPFKNFTGHKWESLPSIRPMR